MDLNYDPNNVFARILRGELPCIRVYEDDDTLAFMDIMPQMPGHLLVLPKAPAVTLYQLPDEAALACMRTLKKVGMALQQALNVEGTTVVQHNGSFAGQSVPHVHFHLLPGPLKGLKPHAQISGDQQQMAAIAERIRHYLNE
ncbi:HIT family protein [Shewanella sp. YIC-542]|uniref:HIT family protein n=1 Tax=Shewanella mytili TaxID=3377111 RepID=UPI00398E5FDB